MTELQTFKKVYTDLWNTIYPVRPVRPVRPVSINAAIGFGCRKAGTSVPPRRSQSRSEICKL
jgi:hypothetical protein